MGRVEVRRSLLSLSHKRCQLLEDFGELSRVAHLFGGQLGDPAGLLDHSITPLARIAHKSSEICERCRLRQRNSPASAGKSRCFFETRV